MEENACGILSYAGLNRDGLLAQAKAAFIQAQPPVPRRFDAFLPLFPIELVQYMDYVGVSEARGAKAAPSGFSIDPAEYHQKLYARLPELYAEDNYSRNFDYEGHFVGRGVFTVDRAFADRFPQYGPFMGEKLAVHLIGGGFQAVAVPESVYPRGGGLLMRLEQAMQVTQRAELFVQYAKTRIAAGDRYEAEAFAADYLRVAKAQPVTFTQRELSRLLQNLSVLKSLQSDNAAVGLYTESARMAGRVLEYVPMRYACDLFTREAVDKHTARLAQVYFTDTEHISDLWIPWQDVNAFVDRHAMTLDMRALCEGYQIAPRYDPETGGGRYPDAVRVAVVRDRELKLMVGEAINNPAYGDGMGPQGIIGRHVYIADSREMLRQRKLALEEAGVAAVNLNLPPAEYRRRLMLAVLQEHKGRLVDAMYRRETVLAQIDPEAPVYAKACQLLGERVDKLAEVVKRESKQGGMAQMSGYDADIDYLTRMRRNREGEPQQSVTGKPISFARDPLREQSIESGYAMRAGLLRMAYAEAALPEPPTPPVSGADDSEDEPAREPLPPIPATEAKTAPGTPTKAAPPPKAVARPGAMPGGHAPKPGTESRQPAHTEATGAHQAARTPSAVAGQGSAPASASPAQATPAVKNMPGMIAQTPLRSPNARPPEPAAKPASGAPAQAPDAVTANATAPLPEATAADAPAPLTEPVTANALDQAPDPVAANAPAQAPDPVAANALDQAPEAVAANAPAQAPEAVAADTPALTPEAVAADAPAPPPESVAADASPAPDGEAESASGVQPRRGRVSLKELTRRGEAPDAAQYNGSAAASPVEKPAAPASAPGLAPGTAPAAAPSPDEPIPGDAAAAEEPAKPKLAYILRRGSEGAATKSYSRMTDMLKKRGQ